MQITLRVPPGTTTSSEIIVYSADFDPITSVFANATALHTVSHEAIAQIKLPAQNNAQIVTLLASRVLRYYELNGTLYSSDDTGHLSPVNMPAYDNPSV